jgi:hypothetical protein
MISLNSLLSQILSLIQINRYYINSEILDVRQFSSEQYFFKIRAKLTESYYLQVRIYFNKEHTDYAYQLFTDEPIIRWDNTEEYKILENFPHHFHDSNGFVVSSDLIGDPRVDLEIVLERINKYIDSEIGL